MQSKCKKQRFHQWNRTVGDPVDIVTGANLDTVYDFKLDGPTPFFWNRYYNSGQNHWRRSLGWGHSHEYERVLFQDIEGFRFLNPEGEEIEFPPIEAAGIQINSEGHGLIALPDEKYKLKCPSGEILVFESMTGNDTFRCVQILKGKNRLRCEFNKQGYLQRIIDSLSRILWVEYDENAQLLSVILEKSSKGPHKDRKLITYRYDIQGNLIHGTDSYGHSFNYEYDKNNRMVKKTDRRGYSFLFEYDNQGRCIHSYGEDGLHEVHLEYQTKAGTTIVTKADGGKWTYLYNSQGVIIQVTDPYGGNQVYKLDETGKTVEEIDPNGAITKIIYNDASFPVGKIDPWGYFSKIPENPNIPHPLEHYVGICPAEWEFGKLLTWQGITLPKPNSPVFSQIPREILPLIQTDPPEQPHDYIPDAVPSEVPLPKLGKIFDDLGLLIREEGNRNQTRRWSYDQNGNIQRYVDYEGAQQHNDYTSWNLLKRTRNSLGHTISYEYTKTEQVAAINDAGGTRSEYVYDLKDRLIRIQRHGVLKEEYRYDKGDNLIEKLDDAGNTLLSFEIGPNNLKKVRRLASGQNHYFDHDTHGRLIKAATDRLECNFTYDELGSRTKDLRNGQGVEHIYDQRTLKKTSIFNHYHIRFTRGEDGALLLEDPGGKKHGIEVLGNGIVCRRTANGAEEITQYDAEGRCLIKAGKISLPQSQWSKKYIWSPEGGLLKIIDNHSGTVEFSYDIEHRLTGMKTSTGESKSIIYDPAGNLLEKPQLSGVTIRDGNRLATANGNQYEYNRRNHINVCKTSDGIIKFEYDSRDMLTTINLPTGKWDAEYDPLGRRVTKRFGENYTEFFWDTDRLVAEINERERVRIYIYPDSLALIPILFIDYDSVKADPLSGKRFYPFYNQVGAPLFILDDSGQKVWSTELEPYGTAETSLDSMFHMPLRFPGHYYDFETGLHYNRFRYYSPELGRYLQSDPDGIGGGLNLYAYTQNPLGQVDIRGLGCGGEDGGNNRRRGEDGEDIEGTSRQSIAARIEEGGDPPQYIRDNPNLYEFDTASGRYRRIEGEGHSRSSEFPSGYRKETHETMVARHTDEGRVQGTGVPVDNNGNPIPRDQLTWRDADGNEIPYYDDNGNTNLTYDHETPAVDMWNDGATTTDPDTGSTTTYPPGRDTDRSTRNDFYNDPNNLQPMSRSDNSSKGGGSTYNDQPPGDNYNP